MELTAILIVSTFVKLAVDWIRRALPNLEGVVVNLLALALGVAATFVPDVGVYPDWVSRVIDGALIAGVSHIFAETTGALRASKVANEATAAHVTEGEVSGTFVPGAD